MRIQLSDTEVERYLRPVRGRGGFQTLLRRLRTQIDRTAGVLEISADDLEKLIRYSFEYGQGGFQDRTKPTVPRIRPA